MADASALLVDLYGQCVSAFQRGLSNPDHLRIHPTEKHATQFDSLLEEYGRFKVWSEQTRVYLPSGSRGSLDELVRGRSRTKRILASTLTQLAQLLETVVTKSSAIHEPRDLAGTQTGQVHTGKVADYLEVSDQTPSPSIIDQREHDTATAIRHVSEHVQLLYNASALLKRSGTIGRHVHTESVTDTEDSIFREFFPLDHGHVQEKLVQWYNNSIAQNRDRGRTPFDAVNSEVDETLVLRLIKANIKRRKQLRHWRQHADTPEDEPANTFIGPKIQHRANMAAVRRTKPGNSKALEIPAFAGEASRTAKMKSSVSTAVMSDSGRIQGENAMVADPEALAIGNLDLTMIPPLPKSAHKSSEFVCPYCGLILRSDSMRHEQTWGAHVFGDLRPYICTFDRCPNDGASYRTRHEWIHHETQMHRRQWVCSQGCNQSFTCQQSFSEHLEDSHSGWLGSNRMSLILMLGERSTDESTIYRCPLCPETLPLTQLYPHVAQHLEQLTFFVLSPYVDEVRNRDVLEESIQVQNHNDDIDDRSAKSDIARDRERSQDESDLLVESSNSKRLATHSMLESASGSSPKARTYAPQPYVEDYFSDDGGRGQEVHISEVFSPEPSPGKANLRTKRSNPGHMGADATPRGRRVTADTDDKDYSPGSTGANAGSSSRRAPTAPARPSPQRRESTQIRERTSRREPTRRREPTHRRELEDIDYDGGSSSESSWDLNDQELC